jgi:hypothetical protein
MVESKMTWVPHPHGAFVFVARVGERRIHNGENLNSSTNQLTTDH